MIQNKIELEKIRLFSSAAILKAKLDLIEPEIICEREVDQLVLRLQGYIWGETKFKKTIRYPIDWKQSIKERWFPKWLLKKYPVKYKTHNIDAKIIYPKLKISMPEQKHNLVFNYYEEDQEEGK
jgi:hypothetical protein